MVLTDTAINTLRDLAWQLEAADAVVKIPRFPLYVADDRTAFLDLGLANCEAWGWPNRPGFSFVKAMEWGSRSAAGRPAHRPPGLVVHRAQVPRRRRVRPLVRLADFETTARTQRKRREWEVFRALADGGELPEDVVPVEAPDGYHVIDYVRSVWLPEGERPGRSRGADPPPARPALTASATAFGPDGGDGDPVAAPSGGARSAWRSRRRSARAEGRGRAAPVSSYPSDSMREPNTASQSPSSQGSRSRRQRPIRAVVGARFRAFRCQRFFLITVEASHSGVAIAASYSSRGGAEHAARARDPRPGARTARTTGHRRARRL